MSVADAIQEAYAANPHGEKVYETIELDHVTFASPAYFITGVEDPKTGEVGYDDVELPVFIGEPPVLALVMFKAVPLSIVRGGTTEDGPTGWKLRVGDPNGILTPYLEDAVQSTSPIKVTYRSYTTLDLSAPAEVISGLELRDVEQNAQGSEGSIGFKEIEMQAFPLATYDEEFFPTLQNN
jgi:hypothetical protein